ncbi:hypothetical protein [Antarcticirhabdus aurantiaca]|uniref:Uncharacterized protein n=1 Tax=Antarcticirhabdus aurantiaca TaxID=2606717 RepID=A0ACD4NR85_9HYPH|nr:hypothetical protein [Antarcticirhabdus aurantiaca]WAJ29254.1 hypothetical protein OXU80_03175 [Jeongeuplla avenae]
MTIQDELTRRDWDALKDIGRGLVPEGAYATHLDRLVRLEMAATNDGRLHLTELGRRAVVRGSPALWSLTA